MLAGAGLAVAQEIRRGDLAFSFLFKYDRVDGIAKDRGLALDDFAPEEGRLSQAGRDDGDEDQQRAHQ